MSTLRRLRPDTVLAKARLVGLVFALASTVPNIGQTYVGESDAWRAVGSAALCCLVALYLLTYLRRRTFLVEPAVAAALIVLGGSRLADPDAVIALCMGTLTLFSMHSPVRQGAVRLVLVIGAMFTSVALSPAAHALGVTWYAEQNVTLTPMLTLMALLNVGINVLLQAQQLAAARESLLARTGLDLINLTDPAQVRTVARSRFETLCADWPEHGVLVVRRHADTLTVESAVGARPNLVGTVLAVTAPAVDTASFTTLPVAADEALVTATGHRGPWWVLGFGGDDDDRLLLVSGRSLPPTMVDALRSIATYWSLAEMNCRTHAELGHRADSDQLTALYNRRWFLQRLDEARQAGDAAHSALLMIDLDDFKQVNDVYGHAAGDALLVEIADRITRTAGSTGFPARLGGDEFAVLITGLVGAGAADRAAEALRASLLEPVRLVEATVTVGASIGIAMQSPELSAGDLMRCADIAMYSAKAKGKNRVERFTAGHHGDVAHLRRMEEHLAHAVARREISLAYQPRVDLHTGRCLGVEALARWHHPTTGAIDPATFVPLAIRTGDIQPLGAHVLWMACGQLAAWRTDPGLWHLDMSVNVAAPQVYDATFVDTVRRVLAETGVPADRLILEITGEPVIDVDRARAVLTALAATGVRIALDGFGAASASFATLRAFPVHQLKIHRNLVSGAGPLDEAMVQIVVAAGAVLGLETVGSCVETAEQAAALRAAGVSAAQGHLYARPMPAPQVADWLAGAATARTR